MLNILFSLSCCYISNLLTLIFAKLSNIISDEKEVPNNHSAVHGMTFFSIFVPDFDLVTFTCRVSSGVAFWQILCSTV